MSSRHKHARHHKKAPQAPQRKMSRHAYQQYLHYLRTHPLIRQRQSTKRQAHKTKRGAPGLVTGSGWITGGNELYPVCGAVAVANSLLAATGIYVTIDDILVLHHLAEHGGGVVLGELMDAVSEHGLGGHHPLIYQELLPDDPLTCFPFADAIVGSGDHASFLHHDRLVTWGGEQPVMTVDEAWTIRWREATP